MSEQFPSNDTPPNRFAGAGRRRAQAIEKLLEEEAALRAADPEYDACLREIEKASAARAEKKAADAAARGFLGQLVDFSKP